MVTNLKLNLPNIKGGFGSIFGISEKESRGMSRAGKYDKVLQKGGMRDFGLEQIRDNALKGQKEKKFEVPLDRLINSIFYLKLFNSNC
jgi:hypothetical protein